MSKFDKSNKNHFDADNLNKSNIKNSTRYLFIKRVLDIFGSIIGILILSPVFLIVSILIKLEDPKAKIIFKHMRVGKSGKIFPCLKFRTMFSNAEEMKKNFTEEQKKEYAENFKLKDDPRITKVGKYLRKTSIDELPQLFNILKGDMSIVGPRPIVSEELELYDKYIEYYKSVKPGLTGLWQINGRNDTTYVERVLFDVEYITTRNIIKDIYIIAMTVIVVLKRDGSY